MHKGKLRALAGLVGVIVLALGPARAQEAIPTKPAELSPAPDEKPPIVLPLDPAPHADGHTAHAAEEHEAEHSVYSGLEITGEYLFMKPSRNAFDYAVVAPNSTSLPVGSLDNLDWEARSGFRTGIGYRLPGDGWEVTVDYTHLDSSVYRQATAPAGGTLVATLTQGGGNELVNYALAGAALQYHVIDLEVSKHCTAGDSFDLRFFAGGRYAIIDQKFTVDYAGGSLGQTSAMIDSPVNFTGGGLTGGLEGTWKVWHGWGLYGRGRLGLLAGTFNNSLTETSCTNPGQTVIVNVTDKYYSVIPMMELGAGFCWENEHWRCKIGYELTNWFNMVNSVNFPDGSSVGNVGRRTSDLTLDGLAVQLGVVF